MILPMTIFVNQWICRGYLQKHGWLLQNYELLKDNCIYKSTNQSQNKQTKTITMELYLQEDPPEKQQNKTKNPLSSLEVY